MRRPKRKVSAKRKASAKRKVSEKTPAGDPYRVQWRLPCKWLVCIDPGGVTGYAVFCDGRLVQCGYGAFEKVIELDLLPRGCRDAVLLLEIPIAYPRKKSEVDPNDLIRTAMRAGEFRRKYRAEFGCRVEQIVPNRWKGTVPKPKTRDEEYIIEGRVLERLDEEETALIYSTKSARATGLDHNMIDAAGMGIWRTGRR